MLYCTFNAHLKKLPTPKTSLHFCFISDLKAKILLRSELVKMIGKVAMLVGLVSKPELNGRFVQVEGFDEGSQRLQVRKYSDPNRLPSSPSLSVKQSNLQLLAQVFTDIYAESAAVPFSLASPGLNGSFHDFSRSAPSPPPGQSLYFAHACAVRGMTNQTGRGSKPMTSLTTLVQVALPDGAAMIEFEDINFNIPVPGGVQCTEGRHIVFRRCYFAPLIVAWSFRALEFTLFSRTVNLRTVA